MSVHLHEAIKQSLYCETLLYSLNLIYLIGKGICIRELKEETSNTLNVLSISQVQGKTVLNNNNNNNNNNIY
jgi:hypothetical protein